MNKEFKKYLPLGSVVLMKSAKRRVMITGYVAKSSDSGEKVWDYIGCLWPEGMITPDKNLLFDHDNIEQIFAIGFTDDEQKRFMGLLNKATQLHSSRINKIQDTVEDIELPKVEYNDNSQDDNIEKFEDE